VRQLSAGGLAAHGPGNGDVVGNVQRFGTALRVDAERFERIESARQALERLRSILRRCPKAASVTRSSVRARHPAQAGLTWTMAS
jgi:hypothetical protein